jgi:hypothetical protein
MRLTRGLLVSLAFAASTLNPAYVVGCGRDDEPHFDYDADDLVALIDTAQGTLSIDAADVSHCPGGTPCTPSAVGYRLEIDVTPESQASASVPPAWFGAKARACGNRQLLASASACVDSSSMPVRATFTLTRLDEDGERVVAENEMAQGELYVLGLTLSHAEMRLRFAGGDLRFVSNEGRQLGAPALRFTP